MVMMFQKCITGASWRSEVVEQGEGKRVAEGEGSVGLNASYSLFRVSGFEMRLWRVLKRQMIVWWLERGAELLLWWCLDTNGSKRLK